MFTKAIETVPAADLLEKVQKEIVTQRRLVEELTGDLGNETPEELLGFSPELYQEKEILRGLLEEESVLRAEVELGCE
jgi:hypothetical protein